MKAFLIDVNADVKEGARVVECGNDLKTLYKLCDCSTIEIPYRKIGDYWYDIVCDEEGIFRENQKSSAFKENYKVAFVGNLLFCNHDSEGELTSLTDEQIENLKRHIQICCAYANDDSTEQVLINTIYGVKCDD